MPHDWTQPPLVEAPGNLGSALVGATLVLVENDRAARSVRLGFDLPEGSGVPNAFFSVSGATYLLSFAYLPPSVALAEGLSPEEATASVGDWARKGLVVSADPLAFGTPLIVQRALLHAGEDFATLTVEGYGEDAERLVWWEVRVSGTTIRAE